MNAETQKVIDELLGTTVPATVADVSYDGASVLSQIGQWQPAIRSADAEILPDLKMLDGRSRDVMRNDAYVAGGATVLKDSIVGSQYLLNCRPSTKVLWGKDDDTWEDEFQEEVETKFHLWADSPQNWLDATRRNDFTSFIRLAVSCFVGTGEVLAAAEWLRASDRPTCTAVNMIDKDRLSTPFSETWNKRIRSGVETDMYGAPTHYHVQTEHPSDYVLYRSNGMQWTRIPARKPWGRPLMLHLYEQQRPDQTRGISPMVTALEEMKMTRIFRRTQLQQAVVAATYAASIESDFPAASYEAMGMAQPDGNGENPYIEWMQEYMEAVHGLSNGANNLRIEGSRIPVFAPGTHLKIQSPKAESPLGDKFEMSMLRFIASALGVSYEQLSKDYSQANYSSTRASIAEGRKTMRARKKLIADGTANWIYRLWFEEMLNNNQFDSLKRRNVPNFYGPLMAEAYLGAEWIGAEEASIDPYKETQADGLALKYGLTTREQVIARRNGSDWRKVQKQIKRERDSDIAMGLPSVYDQDSTNMNNAVEPSARDARSAEPSEGDGDEND